MLLYLGLSAIWIGLISVPDMPSTSNERENYNCIMEIMNVPVCEGLRAIFKQEWDKHYGPTKGVWDDTCISGTEFHNMESTRRHAKPYLSAYQSGKRSEWDISALSDAILFSNALNKRLAPHVSNNVDELRVLRNNLTHRFASQHKLPDTAFENAYKKIKSCFKVLKLSTADVERIANSRGNCAFHLTEVIYICLAIFVGVSYYWFANTTAATSLFRVLPARPVHIVANRSRTVNAILEELQTLSLRNNRALSYLYISGNPGSGKTQLARLVGQQYGINIPYGRFATTTFVMTLEGRSLRDIYKSYEVFARRVGCNINNIESIVSFNQTNTEMKIERLKTEIVKSLKDSKYAWLLIVDNVVKLSEISTFLPQLEDEDWIGGQVLITTQDLSSVPPNSSMTLHVSVSPGMDPTESCEFLTDLSGLVENQDLVSKVAKELDYQPLALASAAFYVKQLRESKASAQFSWKDYLKKIDEGKLNLIEMKLTKVNQAYSLTMSTAVLLAIKMFAENDPVLKHAFIFLSYVSNEPLSLDIIASYVAGIDKNNDEDDVRLRILQCSLIIPSENQTSVSTLLHRVVHDSIKLYLAYDIEESAKSGVPLFVLRNLLEHSTHYETALIPHLKAFYATTKDLSSIIFVPNSMRIKEVMQEQLSNLTSALIEYGEFRLSKYYLILAVNIANNQRDGDKRDFNEISYISFPKIGQIFFNLGNVEANLRSLTKAKKYYERALEIFLKQYGQSHMLVAACYMNLANIGCLKLNECRDSVKYAKLALKIDSRPEIKGLYYMNRGRLEHTEDHLRKAQMYYAKALKTFLDKTAVVNGLRPVRIVTNMALVITNIGGIEWRLGMHEESKKSFRLSIRLYLTAYGQNHLGLADSYYTFGLLHYELFEFADAEKYFRSALEIYSKQLKPSHKNIAMVSQHLAGVLEKTGQLDEAECLSKTYGNCPRPYHQSVHLITYG